MLVSAGAFFLAIFLSCENDWLNFDARTRELQKRRQLEFFEGLLEGTDELAGSTGASSSVSVAESSVSVLPKMKLTQSSLVNPQSSIALAKSSKGSRQVAAITSRQGECPEGRSVSEYYDVFFEPFDTSIVSDSRLEDFFLNAYNDNVDRENCQSQIISVDRIYAPVAEASFAEGSEATLIETERIQFLVTSLQFGSSGGLFSVPLVRASFVSSLNEVLILEGLPVFALSVKVSADSASTQPMPPPSLSPDAGPISVITRRPTTEPTQTPTTTVDQPVIASAIPTTQEPSESISPTPLKHDSEAPSPARVLTEAPQSNSRFTLKPTVTFSDFPSLTPTQIPSTLPSPETINLIRSSTPTGLPTSSPAAKPMSQSPSWQPVSSVPSGPPTRKPATDPLPVPVEAVISTAVPTRQITLWGRQPSEAPSEGQLDLLSESSSPTERALTDAPEILHQSTLRPSMSATAKRPTRRPTRAPTSLPNVSPADAPTSAPTIFLFSKPASPTPETPSLNLTTVAQTASPPKTPDYMLREPELNSAQMILTGVSLLSSRSQMVWIEATEMAVEREVIAVLNNEIESVDARVTLISQNPRQRKLQATTLTNPSNTFISSNLTLTFDVRILIRAVFEQHDIRRYVGAALDTADDQANFINQLRTSGETAFQNLTSIQLILPRLPNDSPLESDLEDSSGTSTTIAIAITAVAAIAFITTGIVIWVRRSQAISHTSDSGQATKSLREVDGGGVMVDLVERPDGGDVSTLGDPIGQGMPAPPVDSSVAEETASLAYDYKVASRGLPSLGESASYSFSDASSRILDVQTDDDTLDAQYFNEDRIEVEAPAGMLGLVLEADKEGIAAVYNMKQSSALADRIKIGDKLVSVDGIDVTIMPIKSVTDLLASKQHRKVRALVFCRPARVSVPPNNSNEVES